MDAKICNLHTLLWKLEPMPDRNSHHWNGTITATVASLGEGGRTAPGDTLQGVTPEWNQ